MKFNTPDTYYEVFIQHNLISYLNNTRFAISSDQDNDQNDFVARFNYRKVSLGILLANDHGFLV